MRMMALALVIFLVAIGTATFLESIYDIQSAKYWVFNALWFEFLLVFLGLTLIANINRYQMWKREKIAMLTFHLSFIIILIGAGVTRYVSFEGLMLIREGEKSNIIYQSDPALWFRINDGKQQYTDTKFLWMSTNTRNDFSMDVEFPNHTPIDISFVSFKKKHKDSLVKVKGSTQQTLQIVTDGMSANYLEPNGFVMAGEIPVSFDKKDAMAGVHIKTVGDSLFVMSDLPLKWLPMAEMQKARASGSAPDSLFKEINVGEYVPFLTKTLYVVANQQFVFKASMLGYEKRLIPTGNKKDGKDFLELKITDGKVSKNVVLEGGIKQIPETAVFAFNGLQYEMEYGCTKIEIPFMVECKDFNIARYPGSDVPSSFASQLSIIDSVNNVVKNKKVFMNHVIDYNGYRFFQSGYDPDEKGTHLSANHDALGTNITYIGYFFMIVGMVMSIFAPVGRFRDLLGKLNASQAARNSVKVIVGLLMFSNVQKVSAQEPAPATQKPIFRIISKEHSDELSSLLVLTYDGRVAPLHTLCNDLLRKVYRSNKYNELNAVQTIVSMHMYPDYWLSQPVINVPSNLRDAVKTKEKNVSFLKLTNKNGEFVLLKEYQAAFGTLESQRNEFDKKLIKLVERYQVVMSISQWEYMKIIPLKNDRANRWFMPMTQELTALDSVSSPIALNYFTAINAAAMNGNYTEAENCLNTLKNLQRANAKMDVPSESIVAMEISYNKMNIFHNAMNSYYVIGFALLLLYFLRIFMDPKKKGQKTFKIISNIFVVLLAVIFLYHGSGLFFRSQITGHAPWSNGYEAVVFIAWSTLIAGFLFSRKTPAVLAGTAILAALMIFVTEMNLLDPEITPLQPVLKSYWLMIHVAIITSSYGFLGLAAILGIISMIIYCARTQKNGARLGAHIREIAFVSELTMTIGIFMLTIGTFLGGIWANESWGRYWGWDPKETWALVSVLVFAVVLHLRYIPGLNGKLTFTIASVWAYSSIIFTFFGVNFVLTGLHSYAQGDGLTKFPVYVWYIVLGFVLFTVFTVWRNKKYTRDAKRLNQALVE